MTWLRAVAAIGILLSAPWALTVWDMTAGRSSIALSRDLPANKFAGYVGAVIASVAPLAALGVGVLVYRRRGERWRSLVTLCSALTTAIGLAYAGVYLITLAFPVQP